MAKIQHIIENAILLTVILMGIFEFFDVLPGSLGYIKKVISWIVLGYLLYKVSLTTVFFNDKRTHIDLMIIIAYFLMSFKNVVAYMLSAVGGVEAFKGLFLFIVDNAFWLEQWTLHIGWGILLLLSIYMAYRLSIGRPSLMDVFHETGLPTDFKDLVFRLVTIFVVLISFFVVVFNLMFEWLIFAVESPLLIIGILAYLFVVLRHHEKFDTDHIVNKIGSFGDKFYEEFIGLFHYKERIWLGIIGMLVFHMLTDVGSFIVPYVTGFSETVYISQLGVGHEPLIKLLFSDLAMVSGVEGVGVVLVYLFNLTAMLFFLLMPSFIWYRLFKGSEIHVSSISLSIIVTSIFGFLVMPSFSIKNISNGSIVGVDILTKSIMSGGFLNLGVLWVALFGLVLGGVLFFLDLDKVKRKKVFMAAVFGGMGFFFFYIYNFLSSIIGYYISVISLLFSSGSFMLLSYFVLFLIINLVFYIFGSVLFVYEVIKNHVFYRSYQEMN